MSPARAFTAEQLLAHAGFLARLARELVGDEQRAADVVQDAYVAALERPPRSTGALRGWLATVVANFARNSRRAETRRTRRAEHAARPERIEGSEIPLERLEIQRLLFDLVLALPEEKRTVLYLRYYEGLTPSAIAARLAVPVKTVKTRHTRALVELRERLDARSHGDRTTWVSALLPLAAPRGSLVPRAATTGIVGGVLMKKAIVAIGVVVAAWFVWQRVRPSGAEPVASEARAEAPAALELAAAENEPKPESDSLAPLAVSEPRREPATPSSVLDVTTCTLEVHLSWSDGTPAEVECEVRCENDPAPRDERFSARTDEAGVARIEGLFPGAARAYLDRERGVQYELELVAGANVLAWTLPDGLEVEGFVVDPAGSPVAGAEIWTNTWGGKESSALLATSSADGSFWLRDLGDVNFGARASGHQPSLSFEPAGLPVGPRGARTVTLVVGEPGGRIEGRVLDPDGEPLAGALVKAGYKGGGIVDLPNGLRGEEPGPVAISTAADGSFVVREDLRPGRQPIHAVARGFPVWEGWADVRAGETRSVEIQLARPATIEGRVLTVEGAAAAGARVIAAKEDRGGWYHDLFPASRAEADADGRFVLEWIAPGAVELNASAEQHPGKAQAVVACRPGETSTCELRLDLGMTISGRVVDADGRPLTGWGVHEEPVQFGNVYPRYGRTDTEGRFLLANVGDCAHDLLVSAPDEAPIPPRAKLENVRPGASELVLVVENAAVTNGSYHGVFLGADGKPPLDTEFVIYPEGGNSGLFVEFDPRTGEFTGEALPGRYTLSALRGGSTVTRSAVFEVVEGQDADVGLVAIEIPGRLEVEVVGLPPQALEKLRFWLDRSPGSSEELELADGILRSHDLAPGTWTIKMAEHELYLRGRDVEIASGETARVQVEVERAYPLRLDCSFARDGWSTLTVEALDDEGGRLEWQRWFPAYFRSTSQVTFHLPEGKTTLSVHTDTGMAAELEIDVGPALFGAPPFALALK